MAETETQYLIFFSILSLVTTFLIRLIIFSRVTAAVRLPPSPPSLPIIGHLHLLSSSLYKSFHRVSNQYGPLLYLRLGATRCILVSSASMAAEIFKTHDLTFASRPLFPFTEKSVFGKSGFFTAPYGDYWRFMKKICMTELLGNRQLERYRFIRREELRSLVSKFMEHSRRKEAIDVGTELMRLTNNVICRMMLSTTCYGENNEADKIKNLVKETIELASKLCLGDVLGPLNIIAFWIYGKKAIDLIKSYDELFEKILKEHEERRRTKTEVNAQTNYSKDLMDILLDVYNDHTLELRITRTHIKAFIAELFIAGTDTSAVAIQWAIAKLINHPKVLNKLRNEIETVTGKTRLVEEEDIPKLPYLQAIVKETLRLYPSAPLLTRICRQSCNIKGYDIPEKSFVLMNLYAIMRDPKVWSDPNEFRPERFMVSLKEKGLDLGGMETRGLDFSFVPFGGGRRRCPGENMTMNLMNITIATMVQCFDWKVKGNGGVEEEEVKVDMQTKKGAALSMANPLLCVPVLCYNPNEILK